MDQNNGSEQSYLHTADDAVRYGESIFAAVNMNINLPETFWDNLMFALKSGIITQEEALLARYAVDPVRYNQIINGDSEKLNQL